MRQRVTSSQSVPVRPARQVGGRILDREFPYRSQAACPIGFGEEKLKNRENPLAAENRRVQVVNMASKDVAAKAGKPAEPDKQ
jgi:hypothetical protein